MSCTFTLSVSCNSNGKGSEDGKDTTQGINLHKTQQDIGILTDTADPTLKGTIEDVKDVLGNNGNYDSAFVADAITSNAEAIKLLEHSLQKGTDANLKAHAKKMIADHKSIGKQLKDYSQRKNYTVPTGAEGKGEEDMADLDRDNTIGTPWDKAWLKLMLKEHQKDISSFEQAETKVQDKRLKELIKKCLPILRRHSAMVKELDNKIR